MPKRSYRLHKSYLNTRLVRVSRFSQAGTCCNLLEASDALGDPSVASDRCSCALPRSSLVLPRIPGHFRHNLLELWDMATWPSDWIANRHITHMLIFLFFSAARLTAATPTCNLQNLGQIPTSTLNDLQQRFRSSFQVLATLTRQQYVRAVSGQLGAWDMVQLIAACTMIGAFKLWKQRRTVPSEDSKATKLLGSETRNSLDSTRGSRDLNRNAKSGESEASLGVKFASTPKYVIDLPR